MNITTGIPDLNARVADHARKDFPLLGASMTVGDALERIRREGVGERVIYFYAVDEQKRLVGVVPTRRLLTASLEMPLGEIMAPRVVAVPANATILDACEFFVLYKFLAFQWLTKNGTSWASSTRTFSLKKFWRLGKAKIGPGPAGVESSGRSFSRRLVFIWNKSAVHRRGAFFGFVFHGCW